MIFDLKEILSEGSRDEQLVFVHTHTHTHTEVSK